MSAFHRFDTALGTCGLRWSVEGITAVAMPGSRLTGIAGGPGAPFVMRAAAAITALLDGERTDLRFVALDMSAVTGLSRDVYVTAREIPPGQTVSYGELAAAAGHPGAAREVGLALARNPFPIVVPCHRVLAAGGALHGFSAPGGIETKRRMLQIEGAPGFVQQSLFAAA